MGQPVVQVDIPALAKVGSDVTATSESFRAAYATSEADLSAGVTLDGWATGPAMHQATSAWHTFTGALAEQVRTFGDGLAASAKQLQAADQAAADRMTGAGGTRPR
ncbi:hypothetical protein ACWKSP_29240 [Micromonosporaceae bacterium Da 78-11]